MSQLGHLIMSDELISSADVAFPISLPSGIGLLNVDQKRMCLTFFGDPSLNKDQIARKLKLRRQDVYEFFDSEMWDYVRSKYFHTEMTDLVPKAMKALNDCLSLKAPWKVRLDAACRVLQSNRILTDGKVSPTEKEKKMVIMWANEATSPLTISHDSRANDSGSLPPAQ